MATVAVLSCLGRATPGNLQSCCLASSSCLRNPGQELAVMLLGTGRAHAAAGGAEDGEGPAHAFSSIFYLCVFCITPSDSLSLHSTLPMLVQRFSLTPALAPAYGAVPLHYQAQQLHFCNLVFS